MLSNLLHYYLLFILGIAIVYFVGSLLLESIGFRSFQSPQHSIFLRLLMGVISVVVLYSAWATKFVTINLGFLVIGILAYRYMKKKSDMLVSVNFRRLKLFRQNQLKDFIPLFVYALIWFIWQGPYFFSGLEKEYITIPHDDVLLYSNIASFMNQTGNENVFLSYGFFSKGYDGIFLYHYFDIWLAACFAKLTGNLPVYGMLLFSYPLLQTICCIGLNAIASLFIQSGWIRLFLCPLLLFVSGIDLLQLFPPTEGLVQNNPTFYPKYGVLYMFLISFALNLLYNRPAFILIVPVLCLVIAYSTVLPAVALFVLFLLLAGSKFLPHSIRERDFILFVAVFGISVLAIVSLFRMQATPAMNLALEDYLFKPITPLNIAGKTFLQLLSIYFIFLIPFAFAYARNASEVKAIVKQPVFRYFCLLVIASLISWMLLYPLFDSLQFFVNSGISSLNIMLILVLFFVLRDYPSRWIKLIVFIPFLVLCSFNLVYNAKQSFVFQERPVCSRESFDEIQEMFHQKKIRNPIGAFAKAPGDYLTSFDKNSLVFPLGNYLSVAIPNTHQVSISVFDIPLDTNYFNRAREQVFIESTPFFKFIEEQKKKNQFHSNETGQYDFIRSFGIEYLVASPGYHLSDTLKSLVREEIVDSYSKVRFYILKQQPL